ncbi:Integrase, catalytic core, phage domain protein, partial [mine drainage metagenome]
ERADSALLFPWCADVGDARTVRKTTALLSRQWARVFEAAGCPDLHFHDLRHEATSRLYERTTLSDAQIAKITGHKDPRMLMRYANLRASDLAARLW